MNNQDIILQGDEFQVVKSCSTVELDIVEFEIMAGKRLLDFFEMYATSGEHRITKKKDYFRNKVAFNFCKGLVLQVSSITYDESNLNNHHIRFKVMSEEEGHRQITLPFDFVQENLNNGSLVTVGRDIQLKDMLSKVSKSSNRYTNYNADYFFDTFGMTVHQIRDLIKNQSENVKVNQLKLYLSRSVSDKDEILIERLKAIKDFAPGWYAANQEVYSPKMAKRKISDIEEFMSEVQFTETELNVTKIEYSDFVFLLFDEDFDKKIDQIVSDNINLADASGRMSMYDFYKISCEELKDGFGGNDERSYYDVMMGIEKYISDCHAAEGKDSKEFHSIRMSLMR